jgi:peptide/nickel transport system permease protein
MWTVVLKRLLWALPTLFFISLLGFTLMRFEVTLGPLRLPNPWYAFNSTSPTHLTVLPRWQFKQPVDPLAELKSNPQIAQAAIAKETQRLGLDRPLWVQYGRWLRHALRGDWGTSFSGESVGWLIATRARNTLLLNVATLLVTWLLAIPLGVWAAQRASSMGDRALVALASAGMALPSFVLALLAGMLAVHTGWLPYGGLTSPHYSQLGPLAKVWDVVHHLALPVLVMSVGGLASLQRQMRGNLLDVLQADYVRHAHAKGLPPTVVLYKHAVRNALNPLITLFGFELAGLLSGAMLVETVLGYPGLGLLMYEAALKGDTNLVMASLMLSAALLVAGNVIADVLLALNDPRVRQGMLQQAATGGRPA